VEIQKYASGALIKYLFIIYVYFSELKQGDLADKSSRSLNWCKFPIPETYLKC